MTQASFHQLLGRAYAAAKDDPGVQAELSYVCPTGWTYGYRDGRYHVQGYFLQHPAASCFGLLFFISYEYFTAWRLLERMDDIYHYEIVTSTRDAVCAFVVVLTLSPTLEAEQTFEVGRIRRTGASTGEGAFAWGGSQASERGECNSASKGASVVGLSDTAIRKLHSPLQGSDSFSELLSRVVSPEPNPGETSRSPGMKSDVRHPAVKSVDMMLSENLPSGWVYEFSECRYVVKGLYIENPSTTFYYFLDRVAPQEFCAWRREGMSDGPVVFEILGSSADGLCPIVVQLTLTRTSDCFGGLSDLAPRLRRFRRTALLASHRKARRR